MLKKNLVRLKKTHSEKTGKDYFNAYVCIENDYDVRLEKVSCTEVQFNKYVELSKSNNFDVSTTYEGRANKDGKFYAVCIL